MTDAPEPTLNDTIVSLVGRLAECLEARFKVTDEMVERACQSMIKIGRDPSDLDVDMRAALEAALGTENQG